MRFPFSLTRSMTGYLLKKRLAGESRFPLVLMLEPLHACNLKCTGCGRIREYRSTFRQKLSLADCLASVDECGAPVVSICGGEPLIYREIQTLTAEIVGRRKHVYLCTNGLLLHKKLSLFRPSSRLFFNVHLDGMEATHDQAVQRKGVFARAVEGIRAAKEAGFQVCTNTTVYQQTDVHEIAVLFEFLSQLHVDGFMLSPAYGYQSVQEADPGGAEQIFMTREQTRAKFRAVQGVAGRLPPGGLADLQAVPHGRARAAMRGLGQSHAKRAGLERPVLPHHRHPLFQLPRADRLHNLGPARPGQRPALPALPDALRLRAGCRACGQPPPPRYAPHGHLADDLIAAPRPLGRSRASCPPDFRVL